MIETAERKYSFAEFEVDAAKRRLLKNAQTLSLNPKAFDLLLVLIENRGHIVTKEELLDKVWANQFVEENNLTVHISALRKIFGERKGEHQFIVTIPGKGYKFVHDVRLPLDELEAPNFFEESHPQKANSNTNYSNDSVAGKKALLLAAPNLFERGESLIGRTREIAEIKNLLRQDDIGLVTLTGAGGTGKTSLARAVAAELEKDFADGVFFVELAAASEPELVASAIAQTINLTESSGKSLFESIKEFLRERRVLLVLDNFEQVLPAARLVKELLAESSSLKVLVTSRAALHLKIEREFLVLPLDFPTPNSAFSLDHLTKYPAITLFCKRAQAVKPNFALTPENSRAVAEICRRLDGLPLAIELAAARVKLLAPSAILDRLENSLKLLTNNAKDSPERQRTMRDTIGWSYDLLAEDEKFLFRRLAIFANGFSVSAAEAIAESDDFLQVEPHISAAQNSVLDLLSSLIDNNLLVSKEQTDGNARLRMLEVVREFALEILQTRVEIDDLQRIHARYFLLLAEEAEPYLQNETGREWLEKLENEHDNFRHALGWSLKNDARAAAQIAAALRYFWLTRSHFREGLRWSQAALQTTENSFSEARLKLLMSNGLFLKNHGDFEAARKSYEKCLAESRETNDWVHIIKANHGLAAIAVLQRNYHAAGKFLADALSLSREVNDELQLAHSLGSLGDLEMCRENPSAARPLVEECLTLSKRLGNKRILTTIYFNLGTINYFENQYETAALNFAESLEIAERMGNKTIISCALDGFAALIGLAGNREQSARLAGAAEGLRDEIGCQLEPAEEIFRNDYLAKTRAALGEKAFAALYAQGKALNTDEAVALATNRQLPEKNQSAGGDLTHEIFRPKNGQSEIIIENHSFSRLIVDEQIEGIPKKEVAKRLLPKQRVFAFWAIGLLIIAVIGVWFFSTVWR